MKNSLFIIFVSFSLVLAFCCCTKTKSTNPDTEPPDFVIEVDPQSQSVTAGDSAKFKVKLTSVNGFSAVCTLSAVGYPEGDSTAFEAKALVPTDSSLLTIYTRTSTPQQTYDVVVTGKNGKVSHSDTVTLAVPSQKITDYYPLALGNFWMYVLIDENTQIWDTLSYGVVDTATINGNLCYILSPLEPIYIYAKQDTIFSGSGEIILAGPPLVGQTWSAYYWNYEIIRFEATLLVSTNTVYENCLKIRKINPSYPGDETFEWWAEGVGKVKVEEYYSEQYWGGMELVNFAHH